MHKFLPWEQAEEVTFECEPGTLQQHKLATLKELGVTRLSLGIENFDDRILEANGRPAPLTFDIGEGSLCPAGASGEAPLARGPGAIFPRPEGLDPWYYWTRGWPMVLAIIGLACAVVGLLWTATVLVIYSLA